MGGGRENSELASFEYMPKIFYRQNISLAVLIRRYCSGFQLVSSGRRKRQEAGVVGVEIAVNLHLWRY